MATTSTSKGTSRSQRCEIMEPFRSRLRDLYRMVLLSNECTQVWWQLPTYWWRRFREKTRYLVMQKYFNRFFMGCIVFNTILLAIEYHGMPDEMVKFLNEANLVLTQVFTVEVLLKVICASAIYSLPDWLSILE